MFGGGGGGGPAWTLFSSVGREGRPDAVVLSRERVPRDAPGLWEEKAAKTFVCVLLMLMSAVFERSRTSNGQFKNTLSKMESYPSAFSSRLCKMVHHNDTRTM